MLVFQQMKRWSFHLAMIIFASLAIESIGAAPKPSSLSVFPTELTLRADGQTHRILVTGQLAAGIESDFTKITKLTSDNPSVATVTADGIVKSHKNGNAVITAKAGGSSAIVKVTVTESTVISRLNFVSDILPILSKAGCNSGSCHAKAEGKGGFKLSIFAFNPESDYQNIVKSSRGRRVSPASPDQSLLIQKPTMRVRHGGGMRFETGSQTHQSLLKWIQQGMPYAQLGDPILTEVKLFPAERRYAKNSLQPLLLRAHYSDGSIRDVTQLAEFHSNEKTIAKVDENGIVDVGTTSGEGLITARFMGLIDVSRVTVPPDKLLPHIAYSVLPRNNFIDGHAYAHHQKLGLLPSDRCSDAEFLRRASLDSIGTLPTPDEVRAFLSDPSSDKRKQLIDRLLVHPAWADHWAVKWADLIRPNPSHVGVRSVYMLDQWLRESFRENKPYDQFTRELLTAQGSTHLSGPVVLFRNRRDPGDLGMHVSQVFLGVRLECAKCHHHPNEKWSQSDFYSFAAYFTDLKRKGQGISAPISGEPEFIWFGKGSTVLHPVTGEAMKAKAPDAIAVTIPTEVDPRVSLVDWMTRPDNPFFARAVVNRVWAQFFNRGIVEPVDDFRASNPPSNAPLLDALAQDFVAHRYDLKHLMRTIMQSHLYQIGSLPNEHNLADTRNYSRAVRRRLPAEVFNDAITSVVGVPDSLVGLPPGSRSIESWNNKYTSEILDAFGRPNASADCPCERDTRTSLVQALHMMNSRSLQERISSPEGCAARLAASALQPDAIVTEIYLSAYGRFPNADEMKISTNAFTEAGATRKTAIEDLIWALINSAEFVFNH